jgi:hypothetical protein
MKKGFSSSLIILTAICFLLIFAPILTAQNSDSLYIQSIVKQQIAEAKLKNSVPVFKYIGTQQSVIPSENKQISPEEISGIPDEYLYKGIIMMIGVIAVFSWLRYRKNQRSKVLQNYRMKKNIRLMREEKFIKEIDPRLKNIRTKLILTSVVLNEDKKVNAAAKKSQIGKEEINLASRIRSREMQYNGQRSFA